MTVSWSCQCGARGCMMYVYNPHQRRYRISRLMHGNAGWHAGLCRTSTLVLSVQSPAGRPAASASFSEISRYCSRKRRLHLPAPRIAPCRHQRIKASVASLDGRVKCAARQADKLELALMEERNRSAEQSVSRPNDRICTHAPPINDLSSLCNSFIEQFFFLKYNLYLFF